MSLRKEVARRIAPEWGWDKPDQQWGPGMRAEALQTADAAIAIVLERAAQVAGGWVSSLKPGSMDRLNGHIEARREIATAIRALATMGEEG